MITDDRITSFIKSFMTDNTAEIKDIETKAREEGSSNYPKGSGKLSADHGGNEQTGEHS